MYSDNQMYNINSHKQRYNLQHTKYFIFTRTTVQELTRVYLCLSTVNESILKQYNGMVSSVSPLQYYDFQYVNKLTAPCTYLCLIEILFYFGMMWYRIFVVVGTAAQSSSENCFVSHSACNISLYNKILLRNVALMISNTYDFLRNFET